MNRIAPAYATREARAEYRRGQLIGFAIAVPLFALFLFVVYAGLGGLK